MARKIEPSGGRSADALLNCCLQVKMVPDPPKYGFDVMNL
jgi:hypothetical protein